MPSIKHEEEKNRSSNVGVPNGQRETRSAFDPQRKRQQQQDDNSSKKKELNRSKVFLNSEEEEKENIM